MDNTPNLALPLLANKQALQTTFHDEALKTLDALVMLSVIDRDLSSPPPSPNDGDRYLVNAPGSGDPAWLDNRIVVYLDGNWSALAPRVGWTCYVEDEGALIAWDGAAWQPALDVLGGGAANNLALLGVGTTADAVNPFSAKLNNALWVARTVAEGGDGDLRYKMSKESAANTLSVLLQTGFSGRGEIGLTGDDDFHFKVSPDGSAWIDALVVDHATGGVRFLAHETSVASAATCDIGAAPSLKVSISGAATITSFGAQPHRLKLVHFAGTPLLTHHATSLILLGGANRATSAGDVGIYASDGAGNWRELSFFPADFAAATPAQQEAAASNAAYVTPGRQHFHPSAAKAWVRFNGVGTVAVAAAYNVSSITDNGVGDWTVNFTTAFSSTSYCAAMGFGNSVNNSNANLKIQATTAGSINVMKFEGGNSTDCNPVCVECHGDQ